MNVFWAMAFLGGMLIGSASLLLLFFNGRVFGVSGILGGALTARAGDVSWRIAVIFGILTGGFVLKIFHPAAFDTSMPRSLFVTIVAGLLVGYGTRLGNGCTSGHGICGISRLSVRSLAATATFLIFGILTATGFSLLGGAN